MWIDELKEEKIKLGLERMQKFIEETGKPKYNVIHVGGTNGKGSVCQFIANILMEDGKKVGVYTSPHLERVNERIVVNGDEIKNSEIESYSHLKKYNFTYFEALTAIAIDYFQKKQVDYAVFEVGLGGRLDATNVLQACITIITNVAMEHENYLGNSIEKIAMEKAGIIKKGVKDRIKELASYSKPKHPEHRPPYLRIAPLAEILCMSLNVSNVYSQKVQAMWKKLVERFGSEYKVLLEAKFEELAELYAEIDGKIIRYS